jgi:hypothetical protein
MTMERDEWWRQPLALVDSCMRPTASTDTAPNLEYRPHLDGLRAVAVGLVILSHAQLPFAFNGGDVGVTAFSCCPVADHRPAAP